MPFQFGQATSNAVGCTTMGSWNPTVISVVQWVMPTTLTSPRRLWGKAASTLTCRAQVLATTTGGVRLLRDWNAAANPDRYDFSSALTQLRLPVFLGMTFDTNAATGSRCKLYQGTLTQPPVEITASAVLDGTGTPDDISAGDFVIGNNLPTSGTQSWQGLIWDTVATESVLDLYAMRELWSGGRVPKERGRWTLTEPLVVDQTGNNYHGTLSGPVPSPLVLPFPWRRRRSRVWLGRVAAAGFKAYWVPRQTQAIGLGVR